MVFRILQGAAPGAILRAGYGVVRVPVFLGGAIRKKLMASELHIGLPNVPEGPDMDLDSPSARRQDRRTESPSKKHRQDDGAKGSGSIGGALTMDSLRQLLQEQSQSLLQAQQAQITSTLEAFEQRHAVRMGNLEKRVDASSNAVEGVQQQVKELSERLAKVEARPEAGPVGPDRRHTLVFGGWSEGTRKTVLLHQLQQALSGLDLAKELDQEPFCTGARRSVALCNFRRRQGEDEGMLRDRMLRVLQTINTSKVNMDGATRPLWSSFSKTPAERGRASLAAVVRKTVQRFAPQRAGDLDVEYTTGRTWIRDDQLTGMHEQPPEVKEARKVQTRGGEGWIDERTLARWVDADVADVRGLIDEHRF